MSKTRQTRPTEPTWLSRVGIVSVEEDDAWFSTGIPVTFTFCRNPEPSVHFGTVYRQDIEPAGRYMIHCATPPPGWQRGTVSFARPLVLLRDVGGDYAGPGGWKVRLSSALGGKKKVALSRALVEAGFDGIVTVAVSQDARGRAMAETSEIVDLTALAATAPRAWG
jgi:hypothetical protein